VKPRPLLRIAALLIVWECVGHLHIAQGALPARSAKLLRTVDPSHIWATLKPALIGFLIGDAIVAAAGVLRRCGATAGSS
jgi:ABC-type nitrate/sulfonate/bicarbonate transport system permease component